jgi:hypothetical protein
MGDKFISLNSLKKYNKQMREEYITPLEAKSLPVVDEASNNKILQVVNGVWTVVSPTVIYVGSDEPTNEIGEDGDLYTQIDSE